MATRGRGKSVRPRIIEAPPEPSGMDEDCLPDAATGHNPVHATGSVLGALATGFRLVLGVSLVVALSGGVAWGTYRFALTSPRFGVGKIEVEGQRQRGDAVIAELAGIQLGQNLFSVDTGIAEKRLLADPWVEQARITRELPSTLRIALQEREVGAAALIAGELYLVSKTGVPFKRREAGDPHDFVVITGVSPENMARDKAREIERIGVALEILRQYERIELSRVYPPQEIHLRAGGEAVMTIGRAPITLHLGEGQWRKKLLMAARVVGKSASEGQVPGIIFLDNQAHAERVVVRMR